MNIGVRGRDFLVLFSKQVGSLVSLNYAGREFIAVPPAPQFWRATTDNDKGTSMGYHAGLWYAASLARKCVAVELTEETTFVAVTFRYKFSIHSELAVSTTYKVMADGTVHVENRYKGAAGLPDMPQFALAFRVPADYAQLEWYAMGPEENYIDRAEGARLGIFRNDARSNMSRYLVPQEAAIAQVCVM